jgi:hypothetical protein
LWPRFMCWYQNRWWLFGMAARQKKNLTPLYDIKLCIHDSCADFPVSVTLLSSQYFHLLISMSSVKKKTSLV